MTISDNQICFLFVANIGKIKTRPATTFPPTHRPPTQRLTESLIIFEILDNRNIFILQNTDKAGRTYKNYTSVYYPKHLMVSINHIRRSQLYVFSNFKCFTLPQIFKSSFLRMNFFSVHVVIYQNYL